jgi:hypothetical protein
MNEWKIVAFNQMFENFLCSWKRCSVITPSWKYTEYSKAHTPLIMFFSFTTEPTSKHKLGKMR